MNEMVAKAIRKVLLVVGASAAVSDDQVQVAAGAVIVLGSLAWSVWKEMKVKRAAGEKGE